MSALVDIGIGLIFYIFPFFVMLNFKKIDVLLMKISKSLRTPDLLVPYLTISVVGMNMLLFDHPYSLYLLIIISALGILISSYLYFYVREVYFWKTFRVWWRFVFVVELLGHTALGLYFLYKMW